MTATPAAGAGDSTTCWSQDELTRIGHATEVRLAVRRADGTLRPYTIMWLVRVGEDLYVRSAGGPDRPWYRHALASGVGSIRADGLERAVAFGEPTDARVHDAIDRVYHAKYDRYGPGPVSHVTGPAAHPVTVRLLKTDPAGSQP